VVTSQKSTWKQKGRIWFPVTVRKNKKNSVSLNFRFKAQASTCVRPFSTDKCVWMKAQNGTWRSHFQVFGLETKNHKYASKMWSDPARPKWVDGLMPSSSPVASCSRDSWQRTSSSRHQWEAQQAIEGRAPRPSSDSYLIRSKLLKDRTGDQRGWMGASNLIRKQREKGPDCTQRTSDDEYQYRIAQNGYRH